MRRLYKRGLVLLALLPFLAGVVVLPVLLWKADPTLPALAGHLGTVVGVRPAVLTRPDPLLPPGLSVANVPVGGLTLDEARAAVEAYRLAPRRRPLVLTLGEQHLTLDPRRVGLQMDIEEALAEAAAYAEIWPFRRWDIYLAEDGLGVKEYLWRDLPMSLDLDEQALRDLLESLALVYDRPSVPLHPLVLQDARSITVTGVAVPTWSLEAPVIAFEASGAGRRLDVEASYPSVDRALRTGERQPITLTVMEIPPPPVDPALLADVLDSQIEGMPGVVGVYVQDLDSQREIGVHDEVVFSGASVIKIAILLQVYRVLDDAPKGTVAEDLWAMMVHSENAAANRLLGVGGGGNGIRGAQMMSEMLGLLGLSHSYMCNPYSGGPPWPGCPTARARATAADAGEEALVPRADPLLQTTPREMGLLLAYIYQCAKGEGPLLERFPGEITVPECQAMLQLMGENADLQRIVAGLPAGTRAAHKSGWIHDMKADAGIVFSPGGTYVVSIFVWEQGGLTDGEGNPRIANLSWIVYSFFNPRS